MSEKKVDVKEFNEQWFNGFNKIVAVRPRFTKWSSSLELEFEDGNKLVISPFSNKDEHDEELSLGLKFYEYKGKEVNWRIKE